MLDDLLTWRSLYAAGRLQKPAVRLDLASVAALSPAGETKASEPLPAPPPGLEAALASNLDAALAAALLTLPPRFGIRDLRTAIVGLSYSGDVRVAARAEDARKVARIAEGSEKGLDAQYAPHLQARGGVGGPGWCVFRRDTGGAVTGHAPPTSPTRPCLTPNSAGVRGAVDGGG